MNAVDTDRLVELIQLRPETPDGESNSVKITHDIVDQGTPLEVVSMRNAILMGMQPLRAVFDDDIKIRRLSYEGGTWMTDSPQEVSQMIEPLDELYGDVLVGGLGLGVFTHLLSLQDDVSEVTTVERDQNIIDLVDKHIVTDEIVCNDLFEFLKNTPDGRYESGFFDIWQPTGEMVWANYVVPLRRLARDCVTDLWCWNEIEMEGQIRMNIAPHALLEKPAYDGYHRVFQSVAQDTGIVKETFDTKKPDDMLKIHAAAHANDDLRHLVEQFLLVCDEEWEEIFGEAWDREYPDQPKRS